MKKLLVPLLLALSVVFFAGCSNNMAVITAGLQAEVLRVQRAENGDIQVTWRVRNPNVVSYVLTRHAVKLTLDGVSVGTLTSQERIGIPSLNEAVRTNVLTISDAAARPAIDQALARGSASYTLDATIWLLIVDDDIEKFSLKASGTVPTGAE